MEAELLENMQAIKDDLYCMTEIIESAVPVYNGQLIDLLDEDVALGNAIGISGINTVFDVISANAYNVIYDAAVEFYNNNK